MSSEKVDDDMDSFEVAFVNPAEHYAQVIFLGVAEYYPTDAHVECRYEIRPTLTASSRDWIGLFKVGWSSVRDYVYFHWVKLPGGYEGGRQVNGDALFQCHTLPKDDGEYYQFCYVTSGGLVRGASTPFQFRQPGADDFITLEEDDSDILLVTSRTVVLEEKLNRTLTDMEAVEKAKMEIELERANVQAKCDDIIVRLTDAEEKNEALTKDKQELVDKIAAMDNEMKDLTQAQDNTQEKVVFITKEKEEILKRLEENEVYIKALQGKIKALLAEKDALAGKHKLLEEERDLYKTHFSTSEGTIQGYLREIADLKKCLHDESVRRGELEQKVPQLEADLDREKKATVTQAGCAKSTLDKLHLTQEKLKNCEDKLMAVEHCKMMLNEEVIAVHDAHDKMAASLEKALCESHSLKGQICQLEQHNEENAAMLRAEIAALQKQNASLVKVEQELRHKLKEYASECESRSSSQESCREDEEGAHYALKLAQAHLEKTLMKYKRKYDELKSQIDETKREHKTHLATEKELRDEIHDLKERLAMGAEEYKMKFIECKKLQKELRKLKKQNGEDSTPCTPERELNKLQQSSSSSPSRSRRESYTQVDEDFAGGDEVAWDRHLEKYKRILETRYSNMFRQELQAKQTETSALVKKHTEELADCRQIALNQGELLSKIEIESNQRCQALKDIIDKQSMEIRRLESLKKATPLRMEPTPSYELRDIPSTNPWASAQLPTVDLHRARRMPSAPAWPPSQWLEKGAESKDESDWPKCVGKRPTDMTKRRPEQKLKDLATGLLRKAEAAEIASAAPSSVNHCEPNSSDNSRRRLTDHLKRVETVLEAEPGQTKDSPLVPLPPPIEPELLPSAKIAAIKASDQQPNSDPSVANLGDRLDQLEISGNDAEPEEEKFQDAAGEPQKICPVCSTSFPSDIHQFQFEDHVESHYGPVCPVCYKQFPEECELKVYEDHVQEHFQD